MRLRRGARLASSESLSALPRSIWGEGPALLRKPPPATPPLGVFEKVSAKARFSFRTEVIHMLKSPLAAPAASCTGGFSPALLPGAVHGRGPQDLSRRPK